MTTIGQVAEFINPDTRIDRATHAGVEPVRRSRTRRLEDTGMPPELLLQENTLAEEAHVVQCLEECGKTVPYGSRRDRQ
jgi:hypothetical protein